MRAAIPRAVPKSPGPLPHLMYPEPSAQFHRYIHYKREANREQIALLEAAIRRQQ